MGTRWIRGFVCFAAGLLAGAVVLPALRPPPPGRVPTFVTDSSAEAALERTIDEFRFEGTRRQVVAELARRAGVPIVGDWDSHEFADWGPDDFVQLYRREVPLADLLADVWRGDADPPILMPVGDRVWLVPQGTGRGDGLLVRAYDVRDLLTADAPETQPAINPTGGGGLFGGQSQRSGRRTYEDDGSDLRSMVERTVLPDLWASPGGQGGSVSYHAGRLIVTHTWAGHREVRRLLAELRRPATPTRGTAGGRIGLAWNPAAGRWVSADPAGLDDRLERPIAALDLTDVTLAGAVAALAKRAGIPMSVGVGGDDHGESPAEHRFGVACPPGPAADALERILAAWPPALRLGYYWAEDGTLVVATAEAAAGHTHLRLYDLTDWPPLVAEVRAVGRPGTARETASAVMDDLKAMITSEVDHYGWRENDSGGAGEIHSYYGVLLVRQTPHGHRAVRRFLADVRSLERMRSSAATRPAG